MDESPIQVPQTSELATPQDESEEFIQLTRHSSQPSSILSMRNGKVLDINRLILTNYVNMVYDEVVGMDVTRLFEKRGDQQPDDLNAFHSQLRKDQVIHGSIKAFQSTGAFSITFGCGQKLLVDAIAPSVPKPKRASLSFRRRWRE